MSSNRGSFTTPHRDAKVPARQIADRLQSRIEDNWPDRIPVATVELEAIEIWLRPLLDEIFGDNDA